MSRTPNRGRCVPFSIVERTFGDETVKFWMRYPLATIVAVEPDAVNFSFLQRNMAALTRGCRQARRRVAKESPAPRGSRNGSRSLHVQEDPVSLEPASHDAVDAGDHRPADGGSAVVHSRYLETRYRGRPTTTSFSTRPGGSIESTSSSSRRTMLNGAVRWPLCSPRRSSEDFDVFIHGEKPRADPARPRLDAVPALPPSMRPAVSRFYWSHLGEAGRVLDLGCGTGGLAVASLRRVKFTDSTSTRTGARFGRIPVGGAVGSGRRSTVSVSGRILRRDRGEGHPGASPETVERPPPRLSRVLKPVDHSRVGDLPPQPPRVGRLQPHVRGFTERTAAQLFEDAGVSS